MLLKRWLALNLLAAAIPFIVTDLILTALYGEPEEPAVIEAERILALSRERV